MIDAVVMPLNVGVDMGVHPGSYTLSCTDADGIVWVSKPLQFDASIEDFEAACAHMPISFRRPAEPWWARAIGRGLAWWILWRLVRTRTRRLSK